ncbi:BCN_G0039600.mRNA.1.CDS.1 [Saccharomyces cerevisiae]|nr:BCN_G0039600.mRNA.1.CDS.1 [Saccharomyces cerevisiae]CAI4672161.1 BCE_3a_G0039610.mRNA.1.CDS.1 [Saccharomyces cerevisiae]CAI7255834.1 BCN_G0039600.mRNA.1.CDS.1 [Saccharomyces cerevisiae]CAI7259466.1 BCE_3a_G0039610.mRNA.1.CDS.1 [Saccharomyces cerevisiae]
MYLSAQLMRTVTASHLTLRALSTPPLFQHRQIAAVELCGTTRPGQARPGKKGRSTPRALFPNRAYYQPSPARYF